MKVNESREYIISIHLKCGILCLMYFVNTRRMQVQKLQTYSVIITIVNIHRMLEKEQQYNLYLHVQTEWNFRKYTATAKRMNFKCCLSFLFLSNYYCIQTKTLLLQTTFAQ